MLEILVMTEWDMMFYLAWYDPFQNEEHNGRS